MAIDTASAKSPAHPVRRPLRPGLTQLAALACIGLAGGGAGLLVTWLLTATQVPAAVSAVVILEVVLLATAAAAGVKLLTGSPWAYRYSLGLWQGLVVVLGVGVIHDLLGQSPPWLDRPGMEELLAPSWWGVVPPTMVLAAALGLVTLVCVLLILASDARGRLRYAATVSTSVALATLLVLVVNLLAQDTYYRTSIETMGRFGLSERSKRALRQVDRDVLLTVVYEEPETAEADRDYRRRTMELLGEMVEANPRIGLNPVTTEAAKQRLLARLRAKIAAGAGPGVQAVEAFLAATDKRLPQYREARQNWDQTANALPSDAYLNLWGLPTQIADGLGQTIDDWKQTAQQVRRQQEGIPDYAQLLTSVRDQLESASTFFRGIDAMLETMAKIAPAVEANRPDVLAGMERASRRLEALAGTLNPSTGTRPAPAEQLKAFLAAADPAIAACSAAAEGMDQAAGAEYAAYFAMRGFTGWVGDLGSTYRLSLGQVPRRASLRDVMVICAQDVSVLKQSAQQLFRPDSEKYQPQFIKNVAAELIELSRLARSARDAAESALDRLSTIDPASAAAIDRKAFFARAAAELEPLLDQASQAADAPPAGEAPQADLASRLAEPNVIIVETEKQIGIVPFDAVWPLRQAPGMLDGGQTRRAQRRGFNGDSAVSSKILDLTREPFARVLIAYVPSGQGNQGGAFGTMPEHFSSLQQRLAEANLEVVAWDLNEPRPSAGDGNQPGTRPARAIQDVLVVLTPPPGQPGNPLGGPPQPSPFTPEHRRKVTEAIDAGTPAVFLTNFLFSRPPFMVWNYAFDSYLRESWQIDVQSGTVLVPVVRSPQSPGQYRLDSDRMQYMPLSHFNTRHPIGEPLAGQRMLWNMLCPVEPADAPASTQPTAVTVAPLLSVPAYRDDIWAVSEVQELFVQFQANPDALIAPDPNRGDRVPPPAIAVAVTAKRGGDEPAGIKPGRLVVMGTAAGLVDGYLDEPVYVLDDGVKRTDPPRANADLMINSIYWLSGWQDYIATGPVRVEPVAEIPQATLHVIWALCLLGLPLAVLGIGGIVLLVRKA